MEITIYLDSVTINWVPVCWFIRYLQTLYSNYKILHWHQHQDSQTQFSILLSSITAQQHYCFLFEIQLFAYLRNIFHIYITLHQINHCWYLTSSVLHYDDISFSLTLLKKLSIIFHEITYNNATYGGWLAQNFQFCPVMYLIFNTEGSTAVPVQSIVSHVRRRPTAPLPRCPRPAHGLEMVPSATFVAGLPMC